MSDLESKDRSCLLNTDSANIGDDASNRSNNVDYGTSSEQKTSPDDKKDVIAFPSCRLILYLMMFFGIVAVFAFGGCFNITIVAMVNQTAVKEQAKSANINKSSECPRDPQLQYERGEFNWNRNQQGIMLAAFYYGYILSQVIASVLPHTYT